MSHRILRAILQTCVAWALLVLPTAAGAIDLTGVTSADLTWTAASGPVAGYGVFIARNGAGFPSTANFTINTTSATVTGSYGDSLTVRVAAYTASGTYGPSSPDSDVIRFVATTPSISVSTTTLSASSQAGTNPPSGSFTVRNATGGTLTYTVSENQGWLSVSPASGTSTGENDTITVSYDTNGLAAGSYTGTLTVDGGSGVAAKTVTVSLIVTAQPASPAIALSTASLSTSVTEGSSPGNQTFTIRNSGGGTLSYSVTDNQSWLSVSPASGTSTGENDTVTITYAAASLTPGTYAAVVTASAASTASRTVTVTLTVNAATAQPAISLSTGAITASTAQGLNASAQTFTVRNSGGGTLSYSVSDNQSWLSVSPSSGTSTGESDPISVTFATSSLASGTYTASITASATGVASQSIAVRLTVSSVNGGAGRAILVGVGEGGSGAVEVLGATAGFAWDRTLDVNWSSYNASVGETRPAACDVDGDGNSEYVIGLGTGSNGRLEVLEDGPGGYVHLAWLQVTLSAYDSANGETFPACGDIDGDGKDEIVVGLGSGGGGKLQIFDDATTGYAVKAGTPVAGGIVQVNYTAYNNANGETHPAVGDFDGDGRDEIAVGFGDGGFGWVAMLEDASAGYAPMAGTPTAGGWIQVGWSAYQNANGSTYPAAGDIDGDGKDELVVGLGSGGQGYVRVLNDKTAGFAQIGSGWLQLDAPTYNASNGTTYPTVGNLDGDDREEILVGRGAGGAGQMKAWDDTVAGFAALPGTNGGWITVSPPSVSAGGGSTRPTIGSGVVVTPPPPPGQPAVAVSTSSLSASTLQGGNPASQTFTVQNTGGGALEWAVSDNQSWMSVSPPAGKSMGEADTITVSFNASGLSPGARNGTITVLCDGGGGTKTINVTLTVSVPGGPPAANGLTASTTAPQLVGSSTTFTAQLSGGIAPYQLRWWVYDGVTWTMVRDWATGNTFTWSPTVPNPNYQVAYHARSAGVSSDTNLSAAVLPFSIILPPPPKANGLVASKSSPQLTGTPVTITAQVSGGTAPYQFRWWLYDGVTWSMLSDWSGNNAYTWKPLVPGSKYQLGYHARSAGDATDGNYSAAVLPFAATLPPPPTGNGLTSNKNAPQLSGTSVTFTAQVSGGTAPYQYRWWVYDGKTWSMLRDWTASNAYTWNPTVPNVRYQVAYHARSAGTFVDTSYTSAIRAYAINAPPPATATGLAASKMAPQLKATPITFTAQVTGGVQPYQFRWWLFDGKTWTMLQDWAAGSSFTWTPTVASSKYVVGYHVRSAGLSSDTEYTSFTLPFPIRRPPTVRNDFDGDGDSELVYRDPGTGNVRMWFLNGRALRQDALVATVTDPNLQINGIGDFDGDGNADLLWRSQKSHDVAVALMYSATATGSANVGRIDKRWDVEGTGDFDGDGIDDVLFRLKDTGEGAVWLMDGLTMKRGGSIGVMATSYKTVCTGDFDGDGKADVLRHNASAGALVVSFVNGAALKTTGTVNQSTTLRVVGCADLDGDGRADVVLDDPTSGNVMLWFMNAHQVVGTRTLALGGTARDVIALGDYDGDASIDLLWKDGSGGAQGTLRLSLGSLLDNGTIPSTPAGWAQQTR